MLFALFLAKIELVVNINLTFYLLHFYLLYKLLFLNIKLLIYIVYLF